MGSLRYKFAALILIAISTACSSHGPAHVAPGNPAAVQISREGVNAAEPALAAADNKAYAAWVEHGDDRQADVYVRAFGAEGNPLSEQVRVNPVAGQATAWHGDPPTIIVGVDGKIYVGWTARFENAPAPANTLYLSISSDGGQSFAPPIKVNDDSGPASHGMHSMALGKDGQVYFAWIDERYLKRSMEPEHARTAGGHGAYAIRAHHTPEPVAESAEPDGELYFAVRRSGDEMFGQNRRIAGGICPCCKASIVVASDGAIFIGFRKVFPGQFRHIAVIASRDGENFGEPVQVSDDKWQINACPVSGPAMRLDSAGRLTVAWYTEGAAGEKGIYLARSEGSDLRFGSRVPVTADAVSGTPVLTENFIVWRRTENFAAAPINYDEAKVGTPLLFAEGDHAAAAEVSGRPLFAAAKKEDKASGIWMSRSGPAATPERLDVHVHN